MQPKSDSRTLIHLRQHSALNVVKAEAGEYFYFKSHIRNIAWEEFK